MPPAEEVAERYLRARCRNKTVDEALLRKLSAALQRRGFSWQDIQAPFAGWNPRFRNKGR